MLTPSEAVPPVPVQAIVYVCEDVRSPADCEPEVDFVPDQAPEAMHESALVEEQVKVAAVLYGMDIGPSEPLALMFAVGGND